MNRLFINEVTRSLWGTKLECRAQSEQMTSPIVREVPLDVYREYRVVFSSTDFDNDETNDAVQKGQSRVAREPNIWQE